MYLCSRNSSFKEMADIILGIESSCDDTSAAVIRDGYLLSNVIASQQVHKDFGGVVPELASRAHEANIVPVVSQALSRAGITPADLTAIAFTRGPGLLGSLLVGTSFAKALGVALDKPIVMVNHLQGHILANFIKQEGAENRQPSFPYLCLLVSGGNSQIVRVDSPLEFEILGQTIDDAVGEAFDKCAKMMGLGYPGGPVIDRLAKLGDPTRFTFAKPHIPGLDYSFSGVKTSLLYFVRDEMAKDPEFMEKNKEDKALAEAKEYLFEMAYQKIWSELSQIDREVCRAIASSERGEVFDIRGRLNYTSDQFNPYSNRLKKAGVAVSPKDGELEFALPWFEEFTQLY